LYRVSYSEGEIFCCFSRNFENLVTTKPLSWDDVESQNNWTSTFSLFNLKIQKQYYAPTESRVRKAGTVQKYRKKT